MASETGAGSNAGDDDGSDSEPDDGDDGDDDDDGGDDGGGDDDDGSGDDDDDGGDDEGGDDDDDDDDADDDDDDDDDDDGPDGDDDDGDDDDDVTGDDDDATGDDDDVTGDDDGGETSLGPAPDPVMYEAITDFPVIEVADFVPFYKDNGRQALAIDAAQHKDKVAAAELMFAGEAYRYDVTVVALTETDGECTYELFVDGAAHEPRQNPSASMDYEEVEHTWTDVWVDEGATIQIRSNTHTNGEIPEGDGTAYARGRWRRLLFTASE